MPAVQNRYGEMGPARQPFFATIIRRDVATAGWLSRTAPLSAVDIRQAVELANGEVDADEGEILWSVTAEAGGQLGWLSSAQVRI